jgi:hypothetical protein
MCTFSFLYFSPKTVAGGANDQERSGAAANDEIRSQRPRTMKNDHSGSKVPAVHGNIRKLCMMCMIPQHIWNAVLAGFYGLSSLCKPVSRLTYFLSAVGVEGT